MKAVVAALLALCAVGIGPAPAGAATGTITTFPAPPGRVILPRDIAAGPDGNQWLTSGDAIVRLTPSGTYTRFTSAGQVQAAEGITRGPDGAMWFTSSWNHRIGRITMAGTITTFADPEGESDGPSDIVTGPDGNLWFTASLDDRIGRITPGGEITTFADPADLIVQPEAITVGADGNLWFTTEDRIGRITPLGEITTFADPDDEVHGPRGITLGPDGAVWFAGAEDDRIGRATTDGEITTFVDPADGVERPNELVAAPDGNLWFTSTMNQRIGRITTDGDITTFVDPAGGVVIPQGITLGGDCAVWFIGEGTRPGGRIEVSDTSGPTDVTVAHPFFDDVCWATTRGIVRGFDDGTFRPASVVSRQAMSAFLFRLADAELPTEPWSPPFTDVPDDHPFADEIMWIAAEGITHGYDDGTFRPAGPVTRQAMAVFLFRLADAAPPAPPGTPTFTDVPADHPFAQEIEWIAAEGITHGYDDGTFRPAATVTRQAMAAFLHRWDTAFGVAG